MDLTGAERTSRLLPLRSGFDRERKLSRILALPPKVGNGVSVRSLIQIKRDQARATNRKSSCSPQVAALKESNQSGRVF